MCFKFPTTAHCNMTYGKSPNLPQNSNTQTNNGRFLSQCIATLSLLSRTTIANLASIKSLSWYHDHQIGEEEGEEQKSSLRSFTNKGFTPDTPFWTWMTTTTTTSSRTTTTTTTSSTTTTTTTTNMDNNKGELERSRKQAGTLCSAHGTDLPFWTSVPSF